MPCIMELGPILADNPQWFCMSPGKYEAVCEMCKKATASFWTVEEVDLSSDFKHWGSLTNNERHLVSAVLAFFAASDGIVLENLAIRFAKEVQITEIRKNIAAVKEILGSEVEDGPNTIAYDQQIFEEVKTVLRPVKNMTWSSGRDDNN